VSNRRPNLRSPLVYCQAIRSFITSSAPLPASLSDEDDELAAEGRVLARVHRSYERNPKNRTKKLARFKRDNAGRVFCESCGFDFEHTYGHVNGNVGLRRRQQLWRDPELRAGNVPDFNIDDLRDRSSGHLEH
jgi:hypothetical protein